MRKLLIAFLILGGISFGALAFAQSFPIWFPNDNSDAQLVDEWGVDMQNQDIINIGNLGSAIDKIGNVWGTNVHADYLDIAFGTTNLGLIIRNDFSGTPNPADDMYLTFNRGTEVDAGLLWDEGEDWLYMAHPDGFRAGIATSSLFYLSDGLANKLVVDENGYVGIGQNVTEAAIDALAGSGDLLRLSNGSNRLVTVLNNGNMGIGSSSPEYKLTVDGTVNASAFYDDGVPFLSSQWTTSGSNIYYTTGSVGIGTTEPGAKLDIDVGVSGTNLNLQRDGYIDASFSLTNVGGSGDLALVTNANAYDWKIGGTSGKMVMLNNGNVGIGTTGPTIALHVIGIPDGDSAVAGIFSNTSYGSGVGGALKIGGKYNSGGAYTTFGLIKGQKNNATDGSQNGDLIFSTNNTGNLTETMRLTYAGGVIIPNGTLTVSGVGNSSFVGNVGIGTTGPNYKLEVNGTFQADDIYSGDGSQGLTQDIVVKGSDGNDCTLTFKDGLLTAETCP